MHDMKYPTLVSVIILNWNGGDYLKRCVQSVLETDYPQNLLDVIVVDNGSSDGSARLIEKIYPQIRLIENKKNLGFCIGNNIGIENAWGDLIILLNNDTIVDNKWIREILKKAKDPKVGIVGCKLYFPRTKVIQVIGFRSKFLGYMEAIGTVLTSVQSSLLSVNNNYSGIYPQINLSPSAHWESVISTGSDLNITLQSGSNPVSLLVSGGTVKGSFVKTEVDSNSALSNYAIIYPRYPSLLLQGQVNFENAYLSTGPYKVITLGNSILITGVTSFTIQTIDQKIVRIADFSFSGNLRTLSPSNIPKAPSLTEAFISPFNLLLISSIAVTAAIILWKLKYMSIETTHEEHRKFEQTSKL